jgi:hypothetical protein
LERITSNETPEESPGLAREKILGKTEKVQEGYASRG